MIEQNTSPLEPKQEYIWFADYEDGNSIYEFDNSKKETSFYDIDQDKVITYGLLGNHLRISFNKQSGIFNIGGAEYPVFITINNKKVDLHKIEKKLVHFKMGHSDMLMVPNKPNEYTRSIDGYFFGYRLTYDKLNIQIIFGIPVAGEDRRLFFGIKASSQLNAQVKVQIGDKSKILPLKSNKTKAVNVYIS
jgi:hypothetical protein